MKRSFVKVLLSLCLANLFLTAAVIKLPDLLHPDSIYSYNDRIYITDAETIYIYSAVNLQLITKFGKKGEGPGEFRFNPAGVTKLTLDFQPGRILVNSMGRITFFTEAGNYIKEIQIASGTNFKQVGDQYVGYSTSRENKILYTTVNLYNASFNKLKEIYRKEYYVQPNKRFNLVKLGCGNTRRAVYHLYNNRIFVEGEENEIYVFNREGDKEYIITLDYEKLKIKERQKEEIVNDLYTYFTSPLMKDLIKENGYFPEYFPARVFNIADNKIFIPTYRKIRGNNEFVVSDLRGKLLKRVYLPLADCQLLLPYPYALREGILYQLVDNEETEEWELHITRGW